MTETIKKTLRDSAAARWFALALVSVATVFAYMFADIMAPLKGLLTAAEGLAWSPTTYGTFSGSAYILNIMGFLILAGIILDKIGVRKSALIAGTLMFTGAIIKYYGVSDAFNNGGFGYEFFNSFLTGFPPSAKMAILGFAIFGCGIEMSCISVARAVIKWFKGKEMALAMGLQMAIARFGVFTAFQMSPRWAAEGGVSASVGMGALLLAIAFLIFCVYFVMDLRLDRQEEAIEETKKEGFKVSDLSMIFTSKTFYLVAGLCVFFYVSIFSFQKFAVPMLASKLFVDLPTIDGLAKASKLFSFFPFGAMLLTPLLGFYLDTKGKGATMLIFGASLMVICHAIFAFTPEALFTFPVAITAIVILGISFSLVPASLWPSLPKLVDNKVLGSAFATVFWFQNMGLLSVPILIGWALKISNPGVVAGGVYNYTVPMIIFASFGVIAVLLAFWLKAEDKKMGYGLELPNKKK